MVGREKKKVVAKQAKKPANKPATKVGKPKAVKTAKVAGRATKAKAIAPTFVAAPVAKLDRNTPAQTDAMTARIERKVALVRPTGFPPRPVDTRWPDEIRIGKRHRKDFGNLQDLADSINDRGGLLQAIAIMPDDTLIAGERRLRAWPLSQFKDQPIPVREITVDSIIAGEWDENAKRKDFTPSEAATISDEVNRQLSTLARARQHAGKAAAPAQKGRAADHAARATGFDRRTIDKIKEVVAAADADPEQFGKLKDDMDRTGKVNGPFKRLQIIKQTKALREAAPGLPMHGPYGVGVIDFPWPAEKDADQADIDARGRAMRDYPEMSIAEGCKLFQSEEFQALLGPDLVIWFWTTNHHIDQAFILLKAIGFETHSTMGTWAKNKMGRGQVLRGKTEHCIIATRGAPVINLTNQTTDWRGDGWEVREDSRKPDAFYALVEELSPAARYFELFSRGGLNDKWDCHGDQAGKFAPAVARAAESELLGEVRKKPGTRKTRDLREEIQSTADEPPAEPAAVPPAADRGGNDAEPEKAEIITSPTPIDAESAPVPDDDDLTFPAFLRREQTSEAAE